MILWLLTAALGAEHVVGRDAPTVQATVQLASPGDTVVVPEGDWPGPVNVDRAITLMSRGGRVVSTGEGSTITVSAPGAILDGLRVQGSGTSMEQQDSCVWIEPAAAGASVRHSQLSDCLFGIWIKTTPGVVVLGNTVDGRADLTDSDKGNGIHLFDASGLEVRGNTVRGARDGIYVTATETSVIADNHISDVRFGIHYMYSYDNTISGNTAQNNTVGIALMGSFRLKVFGNTATDNARQGMLFRDLQYCDIHHNTVQGNGEGLFFYSSLDNDVHHNVLRGNQTGARLWAGTERNRIWANAFLVNRQQVYYVAAHDQTWGIEGEGGNYWSDHLAWDQDGDGLADRPYRADAATAALLHRWPAAVLLLSSPSMELIRSLQQRLPVLSVPTILDPQPLVQASVSAP